jgi:ribosome-binding protein aMBF1 (putative translation factor)
MRTVQLTIEGLEYVAIPRADYLRLVDSDEPVEAVPFTLGALGRNLKAAREHAGFSQAQLAKKLGKAQTTVSGSENGKVQVSEKYVAKVLKVCGLPEDWKASQPVTPKRRVARPTRRAIG